MISEIRLFDMYRTESTDSKEGIRLLIIAFISSVANTLLLIVINSAAHVANFGDLNFRYFLLFSTILAVFVITQRFILTNAIIISEGIINRIRIRIGEKVRKCNYYELEKLGHTEIYSKLTKDTVVVTQASPLIISAVQSAMMVLFSLFYVATLSMPAFIISIGLILFSVLIYRRNSKTVNENMTKAMKREVMLFSSLSHVLDGFKELKVNQKKSDDVVEELNTVSRDVRNLKIKALVPYADNYIFSVTFFYILLAVVVFILPNMVRTENEVIVKLTTAVLFIIGPLSDVVNVISWLTQSNVAIGNIYDLEAKLDKHADTNGTDARFAIPDAAEFKNISINNLYFEYTDKDQLAVFTVGPMNMSIKRNEVLFIVGGNGSGKSTFLKLLTGLYYPKMGTISLDNHVLDRGNFQSYRELYSIIMSEFHLFDKLYGLSQVDEDKVIELLKLLEIETKTKYVDGRFTNLDLSTGQRKRLALLVTYMEDREIYVFDEWAADQDPHFRQYFYEVLVPELKARGKTVIAVTHDDRYFHCADRVLKMEFGKITTLLDNHNGTA